MLLELQFVVAVWEFDVCFMCLRSAKKLQSGNGSSLEYADETVAFDRFLNLVKNNFLVFQNIQPIHY